MRSSQFIFVMNGRGSLGAMSLWSVQIIRWHRASQSEPNQLKNCTNVLHFVYSTAFIFLRSMRNSYTYYHPDWLCVNLNNKFCCVPTKALKLPLATHKMHIVINKHLQAIIMFEEIALTPKKKPIHTQTHTICYFFFINFFHFVIFHMEWI